MSDIDVRDGAETEEINHWIGVFADDTGRLEQRISDRNDAYYAAEGRHISSDEVAHAWLHGVYGSASPEQIQQILNRGWANDRLVAS